MRRIMKMTRNVLTLILASASLTYAGVYEKMVVTPEPLCGPWYMSLFGGGSFFDDGDWNGEDADDDFNSANFSFDNGWIAGGAIGVRTAGGWRFELEASHSQAPGDGAAVGVAETLDAFTTIDPELGPDFLSPLADVVLAGTYGSALRGDVERSSLMLNIAKEFESLTFWNLRPYLGAGVGLTRVRTDLRSSTALEVAGDDLVGGIGVNDHFYGDEVVLGYQVMGGLVLDLTECFQLYLEYRLTGHGDPEDVSRDRQITDLDPDGIGAIDVLGTSSGEFGDLDLGWAQHAIIGVRWFF